MGFKHSDGLADDVQPVQSTPGYKFQKPVTTDGKVIPSSAAGPDSPSWETDTWADSKAFDGLYKRGELPMTVARSAFESGMLSRSEYEYSMSGLDPEVDERTRFEKLLMFKDHRGGLLGPMENAVGLLETTSQYRFFVSASSAVLEGLKDPDNNPSVWVGNKDAKVAGFGLAFSTDEFKRAWGARTSYADVYAKGGLDPGEGLMSTGFARGITTDILLDPATWLTFGVSAYMKTTIRAESKAAAILAKNVDAIGTKGSGIAKGGNLTMSRYGEEIYKLAGRHLIKQSGKSQTVRKMSKSSTEHMAKAMDNPVEAAYDFALRLKPSARNIEGDLPSFMEEVYSKYGVDSSNVMPEHIGKMMDDPEFSAHFGEWVVENFEVFALEHLDLMRGGRAKGSFATVKGMAKGDLWTPRGLASRKSLSNGPASMFHETAGFWGKDRGIPIDNTLGALSKSLEGINIYAAEKLSGQMVNPALEAVTKSVGWTSGKAHGANEMLRGFFTSAIERIPFEDRIRIQTTQDAASHQMVRVAHEVRTKFNEPISYTDSVGSNITRNISAEERVALSKHIEQPSKHQIPDELIPIRDYAIDRFDEMWAAEQAAGVGYNKIGEYVAHIYGTKAIGRRMKILKQMQVPPESLSAAIDSKDVRVRANFAYHRTIATLDDAVEWFGPGAVELDLAQILTQRANISIKTIAKQEVRAYSVNKYRIGGLASQMQMEGAGFKDMMRTMVNYNRSYVDVTSYAPVTEFQRSSIDLLATKLADIDFKKLDKIGSQSRKQPAAVRSEGGKLVQARVTAGGMAEDLPWFERAPSPGRKGKAGKKDKKGDIDDKRRAEMAGRNRKKMSQITKTVFGKKIGDITEGEAAFLIDYLEGWNNPAFMFDRKGKFAPSKGWRAKDAMTITRIQSGLMTRQGFDFGYAGHKAGLKMKVPNEILDRLDGRIDQLERIKMDAAPSDVKRLEHELQALKTERTAASRLIPISREVIPFDEARTARSILKRRGVEPDGPFITSKMDGQKTDWAIKDFDVKDDPRTLIKGFTKGDLEDFFFPEGGEDTIPWREMSGQIDDWISSGEISEDYIKPLWDKIKGHIDLDDVKVSVVREGAVVPSRIGRGGRGAIGLAQSSLTEKGVAEIYLKSWTQGGSGFNMETILHEAIHVATARRLLAARIVKNKGSDLAIARDGIVDVAKVVLPIWKRKMKDPAFAKGLPSQLDEDELVSWGLTNGKFQDFLRGIEMKSKDGNTAWDSFIAAVRNVLGIPKKDESAFTRLVQHTGELLEADVKKLDSKALHRGADGEPLDFLQETGRKGGRDYSQEQMAKALSGTAENRAKAGVHIGSSERKALARRVSQLSDEAEGLRINASKLERGVGKGSRAGLKSATKTVDAIIARTGRIKKASEAAEASSHSKINKASSKHKDATSKTEALVASMAKASAKLEKFKTAAKGKKTKRADSQSGIVKRYSERIEKALEAEGVAKAAVESATESAKSKSAKFSDEISEAEADLAKAEADVKKMTAGSEALDEAANLRSLQGQKLSSMKELSHLLGERRKAFDGVKTDINGTFALPDSIVQTMEDMMSSGFDYTQTHHSFLKAYQNFQKIWKVPLTLPFMAHHARNALTNIGLTATKLGFRLLDPRIWKTTANVVGHLLHKTMAQKFSASGQLLPKGAREAFAKSAKKREDEWANTTFTNVHGVEMSIETIANAALKRGINHGFVHAELGFSAFQDLDKVATGKLTAPLSFVWNTMKGTMKKSMAVTEQAFDVPFRIAMFTDEVLQGSTFDEAAEVVREQLNDWTRLSKKEQVYARFAMPFYSWFQFSLERAFKDAVSTPGKFVLPFKITDNMQKQYLDREPPPGYQPGFIAERLGIWMPPNDKGYYSKLVGFGLNQEEALRQASAYADFARVIAHEGIALFSEEAAAAAVPKPRGAEAPLRVMAQMDFIGKMIFESTRGRQYFDNAVTGSDPEMLKLGRSRLESGAGFEDLDKGIIHNMEVAGPVVGALVAGLGGRWLKEWLEYVPDETSPGGARVSAWKRWAVGQTPLTRLVQTYQSRVKKHQPGEVNYKLAAIRSMGMDVYKYHPAEGKYFRDRSRINAVASMLRQAHLLDNGVPYWNKGLKMDGDVSDPVTHKALLELEAAMKAMPKAK